jgi:hypothetical protein
VIVCRERKGKERKVRKKRPSNGVLSFTGMCKHQILNILKVQSSNEMYSYELN